MTELTEIEQKIKSEAESIIKSLPTLGKSSALVKACSALELEVSGFSNRVEMSAADIKDARRKMRDMRKNILAEWE